MDTKIYEVYIKADQMDRIVAINSSEHLSDLTGWIKIDEGIGDRFLHAQQNYLPLPMVDAQGMYRYKLVDNKPVERSTEELESDNPPSPAAAEETATWKALADAIQEGVNAV